MRTAARANAPSTSPWRRRRSHEHVAGRRLVKERSARGEGRVHVRDGRQRLVAGGHALAPVDRDVGRPRGHHGHRLTHETHAGPGQSGPCGRGETLALEPGRERSGPLRQVAPGEGGNDPGHVEPRRGVDARHARVRVRAPHERGVKHSRETDVVEVSAPGRRGAPGPRAASRGPPACAWRRRIPRRQPSQRWATRGSTSPARSSSCSIPQSSGFSTTHSQPPRASSLPRIRSASSSASPSR